MKKTISITIQSMHFLIEEDAYETLAEYLQKLEGILAETKGKTEITEDIELRIAELCLQKCTDPNSIISLSDIRSVLETLGSPDEFIDSDEKHNTAFSESNQVDKKRLFRDTEGGMIAGVCSGIAAYFGIDVVIIRAIFIIIFFTAGFGMPLYFILWIIVPKASSSIDKLRMQGKPITVETVKEEVEQAGERMKTTSSAWYNKIKNREDRINPVSKIAQFFLKFIGYIIISLGISLFISLVIFLFNNNNLVPIEFNGHQITLSELSDLVFEQSVDAKWAYTGISLSLVSFMFFLIISGSALVFNLKSKLIKLSSWISFTIGLIGLIICLAIGIRTANSFNEEVEIERIAHTFSSDTLSITTQSIGFFSSEIRGMETEDDISLDVKGNKVFIHGIEVTYEQSADTSFHVIEQISSRGYSTKEAIRRIKNVNYQTYLSGNNLKLPTYFSFPKKDHLRDQDVNIIIEIPKGKAIEIDGKLIVFESSQFQEGQFLGGGNFDPLGNYTEW